MLDSFTRDVKEEYIYFKGRKFCGSAEQQNFYVLEGKLLRLVVLNPFWNKLLRLTIFKRYFCKAFQTLFTNKR